MIMNPVRRFFRLLQLDKKDISYIYIYAIFGGLISLTLPLGIQAIIGLIAGGAISSSWILLTAVVTFGTLMVGVLKIMQLTVSEVIQQRIFARSAFDFAFRIPRIEIEALYKEYAPELVNRFFDTLTVQKGLPKILLDFSTSILQIIFGLILISFYHPFFIFFGVFLILLVVLIIRLTGPRGLATSLMESKYKYEVASWLEEIARTQGTFKLAGSSPLPVSKTDKLVSKYLSFRRKHFRVLLLQFGSIVGFKTLITGGLLVLGGILVIDNSINLGQFVAAEIVVILITNSVEKLILTMETIYDVLTGLEKIGSFTDLKLEKEEGIKFDEIVQPGGLNIKMIDVSYQFVDADKPTIKDLSLEIKGGQKVCIAGFNRSGKTTLMHLMTGLFHNYTGSLLVNDTPLGSLDLNSLRERIGDFMPQEDIFKGTLFENITLGKKNLSLKDAMNAAEKVGLLSYIQKLPLGLNTPLVPGGKNLPRSVVTKIILARSICTRPAMLAIKEPFSNMEPQEAERLATLLTSSEITCTLVGISNDPVFAKKCDRVLIMEDGKIIADGDFETITSNPAFRPIFRKEITEAA
ncbi:MAG: ATP-binding cassette domain-containing protein [Saprospiraceae bacterium]|nr:ATP-binding cassette domain-containing protein [Saprospiraceae bacterium]